MSIWGGRLIAVVALALACVIGARAAIDRPPAMAWTSPSRNTSAWYDFMRRCKGKVMVSINDHPDIRSTFDGFHFECLDIRYSNTN